MTKQKILVIAGPTGVGKTSLAMQIYDTFNAELISADSMQIYKFCNIATAKLSDEELKKYPHHLINILLPNQDYSVALFKKEATRIINEISSRGNLPVVVGGTGLYIESLLFDYNFKETQSSPEHRKMCEEIAKSDGNEALHKMLQAKNSLLAEKVHPNNVRRVIRFLEVLQNCDENVKSFENQCEYDYEILFLQRPRDEIYKMIDQRVDEMMKAGMLNEAQLIYDKYKDSSVAKAIGYKEFFAYFDGEIDLQTAVQLVKQHSRNYAKRQITWYNRYTKINFIDCKNQSEIQNFLENKYSEYIRKTNEN